MGNVVSTMKRIRSRVTQRLRGRDKSSKQVPVDPNAEFGEVVTAIATLGVAIAPSAAWPDIVLSRAIGQLQKTLIMGYYTAAEGSSFTRERAVWCLDSPAVWAQLHEVATHALHSDPALVVRICDLLAEARPGDTGVQELRSRATRVVVGAERPHRWRETSRRRKPSDPIVESLVPLITDSAVDVAGGAAFEDGLGAGGVVRFVPQAAVELRRSFLGDDLAERPFIATLRWMVARGFVAGAPIGQLTTTLDVTASTLGPRPVSERGSTVPLSNLSEVRDYFSGKSVCLVANSAELLEMERGEEIDSYDVVIRFNSFAIDPIHTGTKTNVHATIHLHDFNWDVPVDGRLVFGGRTSADWANSVATWLRPGAQKWVGDESMRWPRDTLLPAAVRKDFNVLTTGFAMLLLLDYLNVSTRIDLFGFNFHSGQPFRLEEAMGLPVTSIHRYGTEREWVMQRATAVDNGKISLR